MKPNDAKPSYSSQSENYLYMYNIYIYLTIFVFLPNNLSVIKCYCTQKNIIDKTIK